MAFGVYAFPADINLPQHKHKTCYRITTSHSMEVQSKVHGPQPAVFRTRVLDAQPRLGGEAATDTRTPTQP